VCIGDLDEVRFVCCNFKKVKITNKIKENSGLKFYRLMTHLYTDFVTIVKLSQKRMIIQVLLF